MALEELFSGKLSGAASCSCAGWSGRDAGAAVRSGLTQLRFGNLVVQGEALVNLALPEFSTCGMRGGRLGFRHCFSSCVNSHYAPGFLFPHIQSPGPN